MRKRRMSVLIRVGMLVLILLGLSTAIVFSQIPGWTIPKASAPDPTYSAPLVTIGPHAQTKSGSFASGGMTVTDTLDDGSGDGFHVTSGNLTVTDAGSLIVQDDNANQRVEIDDTLLQLDAGTDQVGINTVLDPLGINARTGFCTVGADSDYENGTTMQQSCTADSDCHEPGPEADDDTCFLTQDFSVQGDESTFSGDTGVGADISSFDKSGASVSADAAGAPAVEGFTAATSPNGAASVSGIAGDPDPAFGYETVGVRGAPGSVSNGAEGYSGYFVGVSAVDTSAYADNAFRRGDALDPSGLGATYTDQSATRLRDGTALIVSGKKNGGLTNEVSVFRWGSKGNGTTNAASGISEPAGGRVDHAGVLLQDGRALIVGGHDTSSMLSTTWLYDPIAGWSAGPTLGVPRHSFAVVVLDDGDVLVVGGDEALPTASAIPSSVVERWTPGDATFRPATALGSARYGFTATLLGDGRVYVFGGNTASGSVQAIAQGEVYDPESDTWTSSGASEVQAMERFNGTATLLSDYTVLLAGGVADGNVALDTTYVYDPINDALTAGPTMTEPRSLFSAAPLSNGMVIMTGGLNASGTALSTAEIYDPSVPQFVATQNTMGEARAGHQTVHLQDNVYLITGGVNGTGGTDLYRFSVSPFKLVANTYEDLANTAVVNSLNAEFLDGHTSTSFLHLADVAGQYVHLRTSAVTAPQTGGFAAGGGAYVGGGVLGASDSATVPGIAITTFGSEQGLVGQARDATTAGDVSFGVQGTSGTGGGTNFAAYFNKPVHFNAPGSTPLSVGSKSLSVNVNADLLDGLNASDLHDATSVSGYVTVSSKDPPPSQSGHFSGVGTVLATHGVSTGRAVGIHTGSGVSSGYGLAAQVGSAGASFALYGEAGSGPGTDWAGYFRGDVLLAGGTIIETAGSGHGGISATGTEMVGATTITIGTRSVVVTNSRIADNSRIFVTQHGGSASGPFSFVITKQPASDQFEIALYPTNVLATANIPVQYMIVLEQ